MNLLLHSVSMERTKIKYLQIKISLSHVLRSDPEFSPVIMDGSTLNETP